MPYIYRIEAGDSIFKLICPIIKKKDPISFEWLYALPLCNFLRGNSIPFDDVIASWTSEKLDNSWTEIIKNKRFKELATSTFYSRDRLAIII